MLKKLLIIINPGSGTADAAQLNAAVEEHLGGFDLRVLELSAGESAEQVARGNLDGGWDAVVAAGGDGTVSGVARALAGTRTPLAIAPMGTANMLAEQLGIPGDVSDALALLTGNTRVRMIDGMEIDERLYFLNAGVGVSAKTVRDLNDSSKRIFGIGAYYLIGIAHTFSFRPVKCIVTIDGHSSRLRVLDVTVINAGFNLEHPLPGIPSVLPDDGKLDMLVIWTPSPLEYLRHLRRAFLGWKRVRPNIQWRTAESEIRIDSDVPLLVQADGDLIGETPVTVRVVHEAVGVLVPSTVPQRDD